jgi:hypothetical protein
MKVSPFTFQSSGPSAHAHLGFRISDFGLH